MPLEFLMSVHSATLMPDLAYDMTKRFDTIVYILLHNAKENDIMAMYKTDTGYVTDEQVAETTRSAFLDELSLSDDEARELIQLGIVPPGHPDSCGCTGEVTHSIYRRKSDGMLVTTFEGDDGETEYWEVGTDKSPIRKIDEDLDLTGDDFEPWDQEGVTDSADICSDCVDYIKTVIKYLKDDTHTGFGTYIPYLSKVKNHWYRDVYFVITGDDNVNVVKNDYDYEALMKERWTEYEVWTKDDAPDTSLIGRYKLYKVTFDEDGNYDESEDTPETDPEIYKTYDETRNQGDDVKTKYVKHAVTLDMSQNYEDLYWNDLGDGTFSAYASEMGESSTIEPMFSDKDKEGKTTEEKAIMDKIYAGLKLKTIKQTGDGVRLQTNPDIKQMFLLNRYFRYDGSPERAEQITQLRETHDIPYGALNSVVTEVEDENGDDVKKYVSRSKSDYKELLNKSIDYTNKDGETTTVAVKDVSGTVEITQDSLNAFSMLENTHTLDADFIYRDFKELIVELGFFTKEELMDAIPRIMEFPVPEIGTGGYPNRRVDKREQEQGTLIHSKGDIDAQREQELKKLLEELFENGGEGSQNTSTPTTPGTGGAGGAAGSAVVNPTQLTLSPLMPKGLNTMTNIDITNMVGTISLEEATADQMGGQDFSDSVTATVDELLENARKMCEEMEQVGYDYCVYDPAKCHHVGHCDSHGLDETYEDSKNGHHNVCCATLVSWILRSVGVNMDPCDNQDYCPVVVPYYVNQLGGEVITKYEDLKPGDIMCMVHKGSSNQNELGHVELLGEEDGDAFVLYNGGGIIDSNNSGIQTFDRARWDRQSLVFGVRLFDKVDHDVKPYVGYLGNEAVVAPMTGILLEYGTYTDDDKITNTKETPEGTVEEETYEYRENVDLNYPLESTFIEGSLDDESKDVSSQKSTDAVEKEKIVDKVGYAKILVLDAKSMKILEKKSTEWADGDLLDLGDEKVDYHDKLFAGEDMKEWSDEKKTVYGFKEFAENYYDVGMSGFTIYMDGFVCELPEETDQDREKMKDEELAQTTYDGEDLSMDIFRAQTIDKLRNKDYDEKIQSAYEAEEKMQLSSKSATERINAEKACKGSAYSVVTVDDLVFIKAGTIIGRTMSDIESNSSTGGGVQIRKNPENEYEYYRPDKESKMELEMGPEGEIKYSADRMIGNYIRTLFYDNNYEMIENIEDYMKIDLLVPSNKKCEFEQLAYFLGCLEEGFYEDEDLGDAYGYEILKDGAGKTTAFGLTKAVAEEPKVKEQYPNFVDHLEAGRVPKKEAQDILILTMEYAKETIEGDGYAETTEMEDNYMFALIDLFHASPTECQKVSKIYKSKHKLTVQDFEDHWGTNMNYAAGLSRRGHNRGILATEGRFLLYQQGSEGDEVIFETETPWTEFCEGGGTYQLTREDCGIYHIEKGADNWVGPYTY